MSGDDAAKERGERTPDADRRAAARIATLVAVPVTILAAVGAFLLVGGASSGDAPDDVDQLSPPPTDPVEIALPELSDEDVVICRALAAKLPAEIGDLPQRLVSGDDGAAELAGAYGEPAVTLRCGVDALDLADDATVFPMPPTCWYAEEGDDETVWTTVDRSVTVEIRVPAEHDESGQLVQALTKVVGEQVPVADSSPTGCVG